MKLLLSGICLFALAGATLAQVPQPQALPAYPPWQTNLQQGALSNYNPVQTGAQLGFVAQPAAQSVVVGQATLPASGPINCCQSGVCCEPMQKICVVEPAKKTITNVCYSKFCSEFCYPKCDCLSLFSCCCHSCGTCPSCDGPYTKYTLVKKVHHYEEDTFKCVPSVAPVCGGR